MRGVAGLLAMEIALAIAARARRITRAVLRLEALLARSSVTSCTHVAVRSLRFLSNVVQHRSRLALAKRAAARPLGQDQLHDSGDLVCRYPLLLGASYLSISDSGRPLRWLKLTFPF